MPVYKMMLDLEVEASNSSIAAQVVLNLLYNEDVPFDHVKFAGLTNLTDDEPETSSPILIKGSQYDPLDALYRKDDKSSQTGVQRSNPAVSIINSQREN